MNDSLGRLLLVAHGTPIEASWIHNPTRPRAMRKSTDFRTRQGTGAEINIPAGFSHTQWLSTTRMHAKVRMRAIAVDRDLRKHVRVAR